MLSIVFIWWIVKSFSPNQRDNFFANLKRSIGETIQSWKDAVKDLISTQKEKPFDLGDGDSDSELVSNFISRIEVAPIRNSRLVDLSFEATNPVLATKIVNTLAQAYMAQNLEIKLTAVKDAVAWLNKRVEEERKKVGKAEQTLIQYKEKAGIITDFSSDTEQVTAQKLAQLNAQVVDAESVRVEAETRYNQALSLKGSPDMLGSIPEVINNELIREISKMEVELYKRMSELSKKYGKNHPQMVAIESELKTLSRRKANAGGAGY